MIQSGASSTGSLYCSDHRARARHTPAVHSVAFPTCKAQERARKRKDRRGRSPRVVQPESAASSMSLVRKLTPRCPRAPKDSKTRGKKGNPSESERPEYSLSLSCSLPRGTEWTPPSRNV